MSFLARKAAIKNVKNVYEIAFYLKSQYLKSTLSSEAITDYLKTFSKSIAEVEIMSLKE